MKAGTPSKTSHVTALYRALHQHVDHGSIFRDNLAIKIVGISRIGLFLLSKISLRDTRLRLLFSARSSFSESFLSEAIDVRGVSQIVLLGAGLDTLPYRNIEYEGIRFFEIDHPSTQTWKLEKLQRSRIAVPDNVAHISCDFESDDLLKLLLDSGFNRNLRTYFLWLGTIPYLNDETVLKILKSISSLQGGAEIVFDYGEPSRSETALANRTPDGQRETPMVVEDEPYISTLTREMLHFEMQTMGYRVVCDLDHLELLEMYVPSGTLDSLMSGNFRHNVDGRRICFATIQGGNLQGGALQGTS